MADEKKSDEHYDLYTEHIVPEKGKKFKRFFKRLAMVILMAVFFGITAGLVMLLIYRGGMHFIEPETSKVTITLAANNQSSVEASSSQADIESTTEPLTVSEAETTSEFESETEPETEPDETDAFDKDVMDEITQISEKYNALKKVAEKVNKSVVIITASASMTDVLNFTYQSISEEFGLIVAKDENYFYVLCTDDSIGNNSQLTVTFNDNSKSNAEFIIKDATTGFTIIKTAIVKSDQVGVAMMGNSTGLTNGDFLLGIGKLAGYNKSLGYGTVTNTNCQVNDTDMVFNMISTDISGDLDASGVICNIHGDVLGVITNNYREDSSQYVMAYGISEVRNLIESLINGNKTSYLGIKGQDVNDVISDTYSIPKGIYVASVDVGSPSYSIGIQAGDIIVSIDGKSDATMKELMSILIGEEREEVLKLKVKRKVVDSYKEIEFNVVLGVE